ncbi:MAG: hypothetical protein HKN82_13530 [Akkermansiaceae bacterium]|nr:hypothetical protein [Akkermansiaceae bacterium]
MEKLLLIANLGRVRVLKFRKGGGDSLEQDHLVEEEELPLERPPSSRNDVATDQSGRFGRGGSAGTKGGMSYGEDHKLDAEMERKAIEQVGTAIGGTVAGRGNPSWLLAAPQPILARLQEALPPAARKCLARTVAADLTKTPLAKLEDRFVGSGRER